MDYLIAFGILLIVLAGGALFATVSYSVLFGAPFLPTDKRHLDTMLLLAQLRPGEKLYDLGAGDGRILIAAAKAGATAEGWEINPLLWLISTWNIRWHGVGDRVKSHLGTYWTEGFRDADVVTLFLIDSQMGKMEKKLRTELKPSARVVSYVFHFPTWPVAAKESGVTLYVQQ